MSLAVTCQLLVLFHVPDFCAAFLCTARCAACAALWDSLPCLLPVAFPVLCCCVLWYRLPCAHGLCDTVGAVLAAALCGAQGAVPQPRAQAADWPSQHWAEPPTATNRHWPHLSAQRCPGTRQRRHRQRVERGVLGFPGAACSQQSPRSRPAPAHVPAGDRPPRGPAEGCAGLFPEG